MERRREGRVLFIREQWKTSKFELCQGRKVNSKVNAVLISELICSLHDIVSFVCTQETQATYLYSPNHFLCRFKTSK